MVRHHRSPQTLRQQAQRLSLFGGWAARSGWPDDEEVDAVVGRAVGGRLKDTGHGRPAVSAAARGPVAPAQGGVPCAAAVQVAGGNQRSDGRWSGGNGGDVQSSVGGRCRACLWPMRGRGRSCPRCGRQ
jgi:hypothetical protein